MSEEKKELEELFGGIDPAEYDDAFGDLHFGDSQEITFKCKPNWNFQVIEFEVKGTDKTIERVIDLYKRVLDKLMEIAPEQDKKGSKPVQQKPVVKLATARQIELLNYYNIPHDDLVTLEEAQKLLKESYENSKK